jgi:NAD-dependent SIR2 family protein deacetylase
MLSASNLAAWVIRDGRANATRMPSPSREKSAQSALVARHRCDRSDRNCARYERSRLHDCQPLQRRTQPPTRGETYGLLGSCPTVTLDQEPSASARLLAPVLAGRPIVVLTGAGVSTESGIPDYRSPEAAARKRQPIHGPDFVRSAAVRQRYWARAMVGWERFREAKPGPAHFAIAHLESRGLVRRVVTQNVDRLHHAAGSRDVIELHGALAEVVCLACGLLEDRDAHQLRLRDANRGWEDIAGPVAPDGDAELPEDAIAGFVIPGCSRCGGVLKPRVVFFGENVARAVVDEAFASIDACAALLVAGTSLAVFSGYRFLRRAVERRIPIAIVNRGPVRGQEHAAVKIEGSTGAVLRELARTLE